MYTYIHTYIAIYVYDRDTLYINDQSGFLVAVLAEDTPVENFVKLTEEHRRERQRRIDAGDETAKLCYIIVYYIT